MASYYTGKIHTTSAGTLVAEWKNTENKTTPVFFMDAKDLREDVSGAEIPLEKTDLVVAFRAGSNDSVTALAHVQAAELKKAQGKGKEPDMVLLFPEEFLQEIVPNLQYCRS